MVESQCEGVAVGENLYGYLPMASHLVVEPARIKAENFFDGSAHRQGLALVYNQLVGCAADPFYAATGQEGEHVQSLLRPLFITSFLIDDFLADNDFFGAGEQGEKSAKGATLLLSSASRKTAYGTAFQLAQRPGLQVVALTSAGNMAFRESLGCWPRGRVSPPA